LVKLHATLDDHEPESAAWSVADIAAPMERLEQLARIGFGDSDTAVADGEDGLGLILMEGDIDGLAGGGVLDGVFDEVGENVSQEAGVAGCLGEREADFDADGAAKVGGRPDFLRDAAGETGKVGGGRAEVEFTGFGASEDEDLFHEAGHAS